MSTLYRYTVPLEETHWKFPASGEVAFTWDYDARSDELLKLYTKGKKEQWDAETRIDWSLPVDPEDPMQMDEQGALVCAARIVQDVPRIESKFYAATRVMDEARHVAFGRLALRDYYPELTEAKRRDARE